MKKSTYSERLIQAMAHAKLDRKDMAVALGISVQAIGKVINSESLSAMRRRGKRVQAIGKVINSESGAFSAANNSIAAKILGVSPDWLSTGDGNMFEDERPNARRAGFGVGIADDGDDNYLEIPYYYAKGSCGGGVVNPEDMLKGHLRKERSWFREFEVDAKNLVTVYADGDSMANYIEHGDMVIFDTSNTTPEDGEIFLIKHVDSERIKKLRREIDGTWVLESLNLDKYRFPDERITPEKAEYLKIIGKFVYRQGGKPKRR